MNFAKRLRTLRREKGLSQADLGKMAGLHYTQIGRYERRSSQPSSEALFKLADVLKVSSDYLMEGSSDDRAKIHIHDRQLLHQFEQVDKLDSEDKTIIKALIDAFLAKKKIQDIVR